ncbi:MAG: TraB/GumN family protein [Filomicrobium sp.]
MSFAKWRAFKVWAFAFALIVAFGSPGFAKSKKKVCGGQSILAELKADYPDDFAEISRAALDLKNDGAIFWRISREGTPDSYLYGTVHLTDPRVTKLAKLTVDAIKASRVVALEVADVSPQALAGALAKNPTLMMMEDGRRLDHLISPEAFEIVKRQLEVARLPTNFAARFKPWVVSMVMAISECERRRMAKGNAVVDLEIAKVATKKGIPIVGLETIETQIEAAATVPMEEQVALLRSALAMADRAEDLRETILELYLARKFGLVLPLQRLLASKSGIRNVDFAGFEEKLLQQRNRRMRTHALPLLADGNVFIAVGALHLVGDTGLVELLRGAGYKLEPIL